MWNNELGHTKCTCKIFLAKKQKGPSAHVYVVSAFENALTKSLLMGMLDLQILESLYSEQQLLLLLQVTQLNVLYFASKWVIGFGALDQTMITSSFFLISIPMQPSSDVTIADSLPLEFLDLTRVILLFQLLIFCVKLPNISFNLMCATKIIHNLIRIVLNIF